VTNYLLAPHVYWCAIEDGVVFLDLKKHKYVGINRNHSDLLYKILEGSHSISGTVPAISDGARELTLSKILATEGLITRDAMSGKPLIPLSIETVGSADPLRQPMGGEHFRIIHVLGLMLSFITIKCQLRTVSFHQIVRKAQSGRPERTSTNAVLSGKEMQLTRLFWRLRSIFYTSHNNCILDSLVLRNFLRRSGISSTWVIGVESRPFAAHSWIQLRGIVLNDSLEHVRRYTPILVV
jgi:transglutaminase superfamily protein